MILNSLDRINERLEIHRNEIFKERKKNLKTKYQELKYKKGSIECEMRQNRMDQHELEINRMDFTNLLIRNEKEQTQQLEICEIEIKHNHNFYESMRDKLNMDNKKQIEKTWNNLKEREINQFKQYYKKKMGQLKKEINENEMKTTNFIQKSKEIKMKIYGLKQKDYNVSRRNKETAENLKLIENEMKIKAKTIGQLRSIKMEFNKWKQRLNDETKRCQQLQRYDDYYPDDDDQDDDDDLNHNKHPPIIDLTLIQTQEAPLNDHDGYRYNHNVFPSGMHEEIGNELNSMNISRKQSYSPSKNRNSRILRNGKNARNRSPLPLHHRNWRNFSKAKDEMYDQEAMQIIADSRWSQEIISSDPNTIGTLNDIDGDNENCSFF